MYGRNGVTEFRRTPILPYPSPSTPRYFKILQIFYNTMSDTVIKIENLGKKYRIGGIQDKHQQFRDVLIGGLTAPFKHLLNIRKQPPEEEIIWALKNVSFEVKRGEVLGIIGKNGAGKSTLLKILSMITTPTEGKVEIQGRVGSLLEVGTGFHPEMTGRENIYLNGGILGMSRAEIKKKFNEIVEFSGIEKFIDTPVKRYSSGMYVRLAFSVAAYLETEILLVDEVLAVGDVEFQKKCMGKMDDAAKGGRTVLFVSHNLGTISQLCQTAVLLYSGRLIYKDSVTSVVERYLSDISEHTECCWMVDEDPSIPLQVLEIYSTNSKGEQCDLFDTSDQINIVIRHRCRKQMVSSVILVSVFRNGVELLHVFDTDIYTERLTKRSVGTYTDKIELPKRLFKAGNITISVRTGLVNKLTTFQDVNDAVSFCIEEIREDVSFKGYAANRAGVLMVTPKWQNVDFSVDYVKGNQQL